MKPAGRATPAEPANSALPAAMLAAAATLAIAAPMLLAENVPPSSTFLNQALALFGWGAFLSLLVVDHCVGRFARTAGIASLQGAFALLLLAAAAAPLWAGLPWSLALSAIGMLAAAALAAQCGAAVSGSGRGVAVFRAFCIGLVVAGVASSAVGLLQVFAPQLPDGSFVARTYIEGRAVGNVRQPNHLASLLLWSAIAAVWLGEAGTLARRAAALLTLLFVFVVVLSGSRTGEVSLVALALWGALDGRLSRQARITLLAAPVAGLVFGVGMWAWAEFGHQSVGAATRLGGGGSDISSSRFGVWANTLTLVRMHPWAGVGFGEFNFAWTLTPFPGRPVAFFDHTHNIVLQFAAELGLPLSAAVVGLLLAALGLAGRAALRAPPAPAGEPPTLHRAAFVMVVLILWHSQLEYPLWYAYFLLPAAFAFGLCVGREPVPGALPVPAAEAAPRRTRPLLVAAMLLMIGGSIAVIDYWRVVVIFAPGDSTLSLAERVEKGRHSIFFAHHADYAAATTAEHPSRVIASFLRAPHYLIDARLLQAWAIAMDEGGYPQHARYLAQRLREFRNEQSDAFFAPCAQTPQVALSQPFQCLAPDQPFRFGDFR